MEKPDGLTLIPWKVVGLRFHMCRYTSREDPGEAARIQENSNKSKCILKNNFRFIPIAIETLETWKEYEKKKINESGKK